MPLKAHFGRVGDAWVANGRRTQLIVPGSSRLVDLLFVLTLIGVQSIETHISFHFFLYSFLFVVRVVEALPLRGWEMKAPSNTSQNMSLKTAVDVYE